MSHELPNKHNLWLNIWTDLECELLLNIAIEYKNEFGKMSDGWETNESMLEEIYFRFNTEISRNHQSSMNHETEFNSRKFTIDQVRDKLKMIYKDYLYFVNINCQPAFAKDDNVYVSLCKQLWGEPFVFKNWFDKQEYEYEDTCIRLTDMEKTKKNKRIYKMDRITKIQGNEDRKDFIDFNTKYSKISRSKHKVTSTSQASNNSKYDLPLKMELLNKLEEHKKRHQNDMDLMINQMEQQTQFIADGFSYIRSLILPEINSTKS